MDAFSATIIVYITLSFIPASLDVSIVKEREVKAKQSVQHNLHQIKQKRHNPFCQQHNHIVQNHL